MTSTPILPEIGDIAEAARRIEGQAVRTPLLTNAHLDAQTGAHVFLKAETLQRVGAFKFRGAYNALSRLDEAQRAAGVVACSSGNHAQGIAEAARLLAMSATIVMPHDAPEIKSRRVVEAGAEIVVYNRETEDRDATAERVFAEKGGVFIPPFDHFDVIAGQGTAGLEVAISLQAQGEVPEAVLVPCSGGGLTAGVAIAIHAQFSDAEIYGVEPEDFDDTARSLATGKRQTNARTTGSLCDALLTPTPGVLTFAILQEHLAGILTVSDAEACAAVRYAWERLKLVVEPGGAVALAALLSGKLTVGGKTVVAVLSGGNIDPALFARILEDAPGTTTGPAGATPAGA